MYIVCKPVDKENATARSPPVLKVPPGNVTEAVAFETVIETVIAVTGLFVNAPAVYVDPGAIVIVVVSIPI